MTVLRAPPAAPAAPGIPRPPGDGAVAVPANRTPRNRPSLARSRACTARTTETIAIETIPSAQ